MSDYELPDQVKDPGEVRNISVEFFNLCARFWEPNKPFSTSTVVRPSVGNGLEYVATTGGTTKSVEPRWPTTVGQSVVDGSVTWQAQAASASSLNVPSAPAVTATPSGITASSVSVVDSTRLVFTLSGGTEGQSYELAISATINGNVRMRRMTVNVQRR